uniref:GRAM domain containing 1A n=1 Tax=Tetraodon nigroviridis TaxID=99883 RepID=H3CI26_TETNG
SDSPLPSIASASSLSSAYPLAARHFTRNAKKMQSWYNVLSPTYKQRNEEFRRLFKKLPDTERLIVDYSCALQKDILLQGRIYLSENWLCFYSNIFRWETTITILLKDVTSMTKEKTAKLIPNAIQISTDNEKVWHKKKCFFLFFNTFNGTVVSKSTAGRQKGKDLHTFLSANLGGATPPASTSCSPLEVPSSSSCGLVSDPIEPSLTSTHSSLSSTSTPVSSSAPACTTASFSAETSFLFSHMTDEYLEEGGDSLSESANQTMPPPTTSLGNLSALDITNDEDLPTDPSNSSDTQEESACEVESFCSDLSGRLHINTVVRMSVDKLHDLLFSGDTHFIQHLFSQRHFTDLSVGEWQQDSSSGNRNRVLSYTIALNNPLGPKTATVVETQTLHKSSARGECYVVDSEVITSGIPYQDYFFTVHRYCLTSINKHKSRLRVSSDICYRKQPWSLVKALIEKNTWSGIEEYYRHMESELLQNEVVGTTGEAVEGESKTPPSLRRRKRTCSRRQGDKEKESGISCQIILTILSETYIKLGQHSSSRGQNSISTILLIVSFILVVLVALNMLLFYKLYALERAAHTLETWHSFSLADSPLPQTAGEWAQVLQLQRQFHQAQLSKWQQILQSSVTLLDQMKQSLEKLHSGIRVPELQQDAPDDPLT